MLKKTKNIKQLMLIVCLGVLLILDFMNIGTIIPFMNHLNLQFWNLVIVVVLFAITYHFVDKRSIKRNEAQDKTGKLLVRMSCETSITVSKMLDDPKMQKILLSDNNGNDYLTQNRRYMGLHDLPFSDDQDIKKLAFDGIIDSADFEKYLQVKTLYQNMISMFFTVPDHPEMYREQRAQMIEIAKALIKEMSI